MFGQIDNDIFEMTSALDALGELEKNTSDAILAQRKSKRIEIHAGVQVRAGNASERHQFKIQGMTADISDGGTKLLLPCPITPGDIYLLEFDKDQFRIGSQLARCRRCVMINEDAFEVGLRFFHDIDVATALPVSDSHCDPAP